MIDRIKRVFARIMFGTPAFGPPGPQCRPYDYDPRIAIPQPAHYHAIDGHTYAFDGATCPVGAK